MSPTFVLICTSTDSTVAPVAWFVNLEQDAAVGSALTSGKTMEIVASVIMDALLVGTVPLAFVSLPKCVYLYL